MTASRRIVIQAYRAEWPSDFAAVKGLLRAALGDVADRIDHIGSTAVPGLAAKDIIDVQVSVPDLDDPRLAAAMERLGATATDITTATTSATRQPLPLPTPRSRWLSRACTRTTRAPTTT